MKRWYRVGFFCYAVGVALLCRAAEPTAIPPEDENPNAVRPTGVLPHRQHSKSKSAASAKSDSDESTSATPRPRRTHRSTAKSRESDAEPVKLNIKPGDTYQRIDLLRALLVKSPNDVARCLARDNAGSIEAFAARMNERASALGARNSHFVNPNGLPDGRQYSTARDLSTIARVAYANSTIRSIV